ncbi:MAG: nucleoside triphosphate pyrophosphohydrolase [Patescibacteria group bacterium]|jgi:predicted house-cleaning noncanonical NTP pyrophosphatase (MazG superfamily)
MAKKKYHRKLVRDRIPEIIEKNGDEVYTKILTLKQYQRELKKKIAEEAKEVIKAKTKTDVIEELADILECVDTLSESYGVPRYALERTQREKRARRGGFKKRIYLLATSH